MKVTQIDCKSSGLICVKSYMCQLMTVNSKVCTRSIFFVLRMPIFCCRWLGTESNECLEVVSHFDESDESECLEATFVNHICHRGCLVSEKHVGHSECTVRMRPCWSSKDA